MSLSKKFLASAAAGLTALMMVGCVADEPTPEVPVQVENPAPAEPGEPGDAPAPGEEVTGPVFEGGEISTETITANLMDIQIPTGIRIPENALVTDAQPTSIMIADEDPTEVVEMVEASAAEAGYEVFAEVTDGKVFVGHGNAVLFQATANFQLLTWGPEAMAEVLSEI